MELACRVNLRFALIFCNLELLLREAACVCSNIWPREYMTEFKVSSSVGRTNVTWWRGGEFAGEGEAEINSCAKTSFIDNHDGQ